VFLVRAFAGDKSTSAAAKETVSSGRINNTPKLWILLVIRCIDLEFVNKTCSKSFPNLLDEEIDKTVENLLLEQQKQKPRPGSHGLNKIVTSLKSNLWELKSLTRLPYIVTGIDKICED